MCPNSKVTALGFLCFRITIRDEHVGEAFLCLDLGSWGMNLVEKEK